MAVQVAQPPQASPWSRAYPPLAFLALAVLIAIFVLPSSLNLPQSNPSTVLEYAPVPPEDEEPNPPPGNLSSLGLGSSGTLTAGGQPPPPPPPPPPGSKGAGAKPQVKRCYGTPPRQTEDLASPPCVGFFEGDNFGVTYQGVTKDEVTVLIYHDVGAPDGETSPEAGTWVDIDGPPKPACPKTWPATNPQRAQCDDLWVRITRAFNIYFNDRFQTYNRHVHYLMQYTSASTAAARRADAQDAWSRYKPFAVIDRATFNGYNDAYEDTLAGRNVLTFTSETALANKFFNKNKPFAWGFWPDVEHWAALYDQYVCKKVVGGTARTGSFAGQKRKFGLWYTTDASEPGLRLFADLAKAELEKCGVQKPFVEATYSDSGFIVNNDDPGSEAVTAANRFFQSGVTTVLYLGGLEGKLSQAMDRIAYYPEIVVAGDLDNDNNNTARLQNQNVWKNASAASLQIKYDRPEDTPGYRAFSDVDPRAVPAEARLINDAYRDHFMLFQAIQVAGPDLTPETVDQGFHAIPEQRSSNPYVPALFMDQNDFTFAKDATVTWWDPTGDSKGSDDPGCWRIVDGGTRYRAEHWPPGEANFQPTDGCTSFEGGRPINP